MKTATLLLAVFALIVATVQAVSLGTNAERMARGLPPRAPSKLFKPTAASAAKRSKPSGSPGGSCSTGPVQCCEEITNASNPIAELLLSLLGLVVGPDVAIGLTCSPLSIIGIGGGSCSANTVCCENNALGGLISIGCIPIIL